jgi:hypothetical protein
MIDPTQLRNWVLAIVAVTALLTSFLAYGKRVVAQEARKEAAAQMAPAVEELGEIKELLRRQEDREAFKTCMDYTHQELSNEARLQECTQESNARYAYWDCQDRTPKDEWLAKCGVKP